MVEKNGESTPRMFDCAKVELNPFEVSDEI